MPSAARPKLFYLRETVSGLRSLYRGVFRGMYRDYLLPTVPTSIGSPAYVVRAHVFGLADAIPESSGIDKYAASDHRAFMWLCVHDIRSERPDCT